MPTLHIEHAITDYATWRAAFDRFTEVRAQAGVRRYRIHQPVDDTRFVVIDLDFDTTDAAVSFRDFLQTKIWSSPQSAPALVGTPQARVLEPVLEPVLEG